MSYREEVIKMRQIFMAMGINPNDVLTTDDVDEHYDIDLKPIPNIRRISKDLKWLTGASYLDRFDIGDFTGSLEVLATVKNIRVLNGVELNQIDILSKLPNLCVVGVYDPQEADAQKIADFTYATSVTARNSSTTASPCP